jgi:GlcNAc-PI de-N-acetylase
MAESMLSKYISRPWISMWSVFAVLTVVMGGAPQHVAAATPPAPSVQLDWAYCATHPRTAVVVAHADDDRYFFGDEVRQRIKSGHCLKVVHVNAGFDVKPDGDAPSSDPWYYQKRIDGAKAAYAGMLQRAYPGTTITITNSWDSVAGFSLNRYIVSSAMKGDQPSGQLIEIQILGLPNSSNAGPASQAGNVTSVLYADAAASAPNVAPYDTKNVYHWADLQNILNTTLGWTNPREVLALDPYGVPGDDGHQGQHPDHIMAARLVQNSSYARDYPSQVRYFKTYSVNDLISNVTDAVGQDSQIDLAAHWKYDWGVSWMSSTPCSKMSHGRQGVGMFTPYAWACKRYEASSKEYFAAGLLVAAGSKCLNADPSGNLGFGVCGVNSVPVSIGRSGLAWVSDASSNTAGKKLAIQNTSTTIDTALTLVNYDTAQSEVGSARGSRWRYDATNSTMVMQYNDTKSGNYLSLCMGANASGRAVLVGCTNAAVSKVSVKPREKVFKPVTGSQNIKLKYADSGLCMALGSTLSLTTCDSAGTMLKLQSDGSISSQDGLRCLNMPTFGTEGSSIKSAACVVGHPGQRFALDQIGSANAATLRPALDQVCAEGDLAVYPCHVYHQQQWVVMPQ